jgi:hypothetical protein
MINLFRRKRYRVQVTSDGVDKLYSVYRISKTEPCHVKFTTDEGKLVEIRTTTPMDIIVEEV